MSFKIPFTFGSLDKTKKRASILKKYIHHKKQSPLKLYLENADIDITREEYLAICRYSAITTAFYIFLLGTTTFILLKAPNAVLLALGIAVICSLFVYASQRVYPRVYATRKEKEIERNLIPALQDMLVQLNAGIPLFSILVNISAEDYGPLSTEFKKAVRRINAGFPQIEVLEKLGDQNPSRFFRRTLWQLSNGMRAGSDLAIVIKDSIRSLNDEQLIQIQNYGNKLNPMIMFYMLVSVIMPALSITFLTVITSLVNISSTLVNLLFIGVFAGVVFIQTMFLGIIRSLRPSLL